VTLQPPHISIQVDTWAGALVALGLILPLAIVAIGGGYILGVSILDRFSRTVLGTHIRHFFVRLAPPKRFDEDDRRYVERLIVEGIKRRGIKLKDFVQ